MVVELEQMDEELEQMAEELEQMAEELEQMVCQSGRTESFFQSESCVDDQTDHSSYQLSPHH